jgi:hypothetical protein
MISIALSRRRTLLGLAAGAMLPSAAARAEAPCPAGPFILTVAGLIGAPNRGALDPQRDRLFNNNNLSFQKARTFSAAELLGFPQQPVKTNSYGVDLDAKGPLLGSILAAASPPPAAKTARLSAIDGYAAEIPLAEIQSQQWILAMEANGRPFAIGDFGPLYAMRQLKPAEKKNEEEEAKWVHSLYYIELMP